MSAWTSVPKPQESSILGFEGGEPIGLLLALTKTTRVSSVTSGWTDITQPSVLGWTSVTKPVSSVWTAVAKPID